MIDLLANLPAIIGGAMALIVTVWGYGKAKQRKGRKTGADQVRRRAQAGAEDRKDKRYEIDDDVRSVDAASELHDKWTRD